MATTTAQVGNLLITTQVVHASSTTGSDVPQSTTILTPMPSKHFKKTPVKALSTILILIGILQLLMGFTFYATETKIVSLTLKSGVYIWGGLMVFISGVACLIAFLKDTIYMIKVCMTCNIGNIVVATVGLILYAVQIYIETQVCWIPANSQDDNQCPVKPDQTYYSYYSYYYYNTDLIMKSRVSLNIVIILFSLLGLVISSFMTKVSDKALKTSGYSLLK